MANLIIDTSTKFVYVSYDSKTLISEKEMNHLEVLPDMVNELVDQKSKIEAIFVGVGPGSYTGLRVGTLFAQALAQSLNVKCLGVDSAHILQYRSGDSGSSTGSSSDANTGAAEASPVDAANGEASNPNSVLNITYYSKSQSAIPQKYIKAEPKQIYDDGYLK